MVEAAELQLTIEKACTAKPGKLSECLNIPHAVDALEPAKMLLVMLREPETLTWR